MKNIKALRNFGLGDRHIEAGTTLTVDPADFGGTYDDFKAAGMFEEIEPESTATTPAPETKPAPVTKPVTAAKGTIATEPDGTKVALPAGTVVTEAP